MWARGWVVGTGHVSATWALTAGGGLRRWQEGFGGRNNGGARRDSGPVACWEHSVEGYRKVWSQFLPRCYVLLRSLFSQAVPAPSLDPALCRS